MYLWYLLLVVTKFQGWIGLQRVLLFYLLDRFTFRSISESSVIRDGFEDTRGFVSMENWKIEMKLKNR